MVKLTIQGISIQWNDDGTGICSTTNQLVHIPDMGLLRHSLGVLESIRLLSMDGEMGEDTHG